MRGTSLSRGQAWQATGGVTFLPKGEGVDLVTLALPTGTYLMTAKATVGDWQRRRSRRRRVHDHGGFAMVPSPPSLLRPAPSTAQRSPRTMWGRQARRSFTGLHARICGHDQVHLYSPGGDDESDEAGDVTMTAIRVGTVHTP